MLDPWDCTNSAFDRMGQELYNAKVEKRRKERSKMVSQAPQKKNSSPSVDFLKFTDFYDFEIGDRVYIYDTFNDEYVMAVDKFKDGIICYKPALFRIVKPVREYDPFLQFDNTVYDIRDMSVLSRIWMGIISAFLRDQSLYHKNKLDKERFQYKFIRFGNMGPTELRKHSYIKYKDDIQDSKSLEEIIRSVCQLYNIFPGRKFYIYNIEEKIYRSRKVFEHNGDVKIIPTEFTYENNLITADEEDSEYAKTVFKQIYDDFFVRKGGATKYRLVRSDMMKESDLNVAVVPNMFKVTPPGPITQAIELKFIENNIKNDDGCYYHFYLRCCAVDRDSWNIMTKLEGNSIVMIEFKYTSPEGLTAINVDQSEIDFSHLKALEEEILSGELIPVDIDVWQEKIKKSDESGITIKSFNLKPSL